MAKKDLKIVSWNVNGIRASVRSGFLEFLKKEKPDILALQEIKVDDIAREKAQFDFSDYVECWHPAERKGYSGTAILVRNETWKNFNCEKVRNGLGINKFDCEGRVQTLELPDFYLVNTYFPNANHELSRLGYKLEFNLEILKYLKKLENLPAGKAGKKPVVICGDFNVAHQEIDLKNPKANIGNAGFTFEEREWIDELIRKGYIDTFRHLHPDKAQYSWWSYRFNARPRNIGWRIDYFFVSKSFISNIKNAQIYDQVRGSDHCPVSIMI